MPFGMSEASDELLAFYITLCFNRALSIQNRTGISPLAELLDNMNPYTKRTLKEYFIEQFPLLRNYSWKLAEKVDKIYRLS